MEEKFNVTLYKSLNQKMHEKHKNNFQITFGELYNQMTKEMKLYEKEDQLEELLNQKMLVNVSDVEGQIIKGYITDLIGFLEGGDILIVSNLDEIYGVKE